MTDAIVAGVQASDAEPDSPDRARRLFRYLNGDEWTEYRAIIAVFADTFFAEFTPDDVTAALARSNIHLDPSVVADRLERLRDWGNLTVSSSIGQPSNLADYYRRRNRYLITRAGQEVYGLVEGVLSRVDEVRDISTGRLRTLLGSLSELASVDLDVVGDERISDLVRAVFDAHTAFADEITQFSASINQWQSRYDLDPDEFRFFAEVLVGYVAERLDEIERAARPIGRHLSEMGPRLPAIAGRVQRGLAGRVEQAGLAGSIAVTGTHGSDPADWQHLSAWFIAQPNSPSRIQRLGRDAIAAIRTLTLNLTRLSRIGIGASSRRADFLRLASIFHHAAPDDVPQLGVAAFGLHAPQHLGVVAEDSLDPVSSATSWWSAPRAQVPVSIRERGDTTNRGRPTPVADRSAAQELVRRRREAERQARERVDVELLDIGDMDGARLSQRAMQRLLGLVGRTSHGSQIAARERSLTDGALTCLVQREPGLRTVVRSPEGELTLIDRRISIHAANHADGHGASSQ
jgi:uncharacterized protein (TIGR02677 family)